ncbi:MAG: efflux RND transporter permease subunit, partial [Dehalococcoidia bacterium]
MMRLVVRASLRFRFIIIALAAAMMVFGAGRLPDAPVDVFPEFAPPRVEIQTISIGMSSAEVESLVTVPIELPDGKRVEIHGIVDKVRSRFEGARFDSDSQLANDEIMPVDIANAAHVAVTRVDPEIFVAPFPGARVFVSTGATRDKALYFDKMREAGTAFCAGFARDGQPIYGNLEFLDGTRGAHMNISGISGVATKTSYALFLLYSLLHSDVLGRDAANTKAIIFNVKGEDLLFLDKPNRKLDDDARSRYAAMGLDAGPFQSVVIWSPARKEAFHPSSNTRPDAKPYAWSLDEFCRSRMIGFLFAEADSETSRLSSVIRMVERWLADANVVGPPDANGFIDVLGQTVRDFNDLVLAIDTNIEAAAHGEAGGSQQAFMRRLWDAVYTTGHLIRAIPPDEVNDKTIRILDGGNAGENKQAIVIDINDLHDRAKRFVVGSVVRRLVEQKEGRPRPLVFLVLDELNKYAPREGWSPIKEVILDIAERGRSLGVILVGAQQTASEIERRVTANASFRVAGRLDSAEASRGEYGFLTDAARARASILKP